MSSSKIAFRNYFGEVFYWPTKRKGFPSLQKLSWNPPEFVKKIKWWKLQGAHSKKTNHDKRKGVPETETSDPPGNGYISPPILTSESMIFRASHLVGYVSVPWSCYFTENPPKKKTLHPWSLTTSPPESHGWLGQEDFKSGFLLGWKVGHFSGLVPLLQQLQATWMLRLEIPGFFSPLRDLIWGLCTQVVLHHVKSKDVKTTTRRGNFWTLITECFVERKKTGS